MSEKHKSQEWRELEVCRFCESTEIKQERRNMVDGVEMTGNWEWYCSECGAHGHPPITIILVDREDAT